MEDQDVYIWTRTFSINWQKPLVTNHKMRLQLYVMHRQNSEIQNVLVSRPSKLSSLKVVNRYEFTSSYMAHEDKNFGGSLV